MAGEKILVVEDSMVVSSRLKWLLTREGYAVTATITGEEAIDLADKNKPDLILMDIMLAGKLSGIEAAALIHEAHKVPILYLTALTDRKTLELAKSTGPDSYITKPYDENDLLTRIAISLVKARTERENELKTMAALIEGQERERARVSRELHDGLGQLLNAVQLHLDSHSQTSEISTLIHDAIEEVRRISENLLPRKLINFDLSTCLASLCEQSSSKKTRVIFQTKPFESTLSEKQKLMLYRVAQEALQNALRHAMATRVFVQLYESPENVSLTVEDNGKGFSHRAGRNGSGIENMRYRAKMLNGALHLDSIEGSGTLVSLIVPVTSE